MAAPTPGTRPTGITILAILAAIAGVLGLIGSLAVIGLGGALSAVGYGGLYSLVGFGILAISIAYIVFAYGAWMLRPWAWTLGVAAVAANIILQIFWITQGASIGSVILSVIISLAILYYLDTPAVRSAFGKAGNSWFAGLTARK
jgi:hypothetical protein